MKYFYLFSLLLLFACRQQPVEKTDWQKIANEIETELNSNILDSWYPACIDTAYGGYMSNFDSQFEPMEQQEKMIVTQARQLWATSQVAMRTGSSDYLSYAAHGLPFLQKMWDDTYGGFYQNVDRSGVPLDSTEVKTAYGNSFAIYGLSAYYAASKDSAALDLAIQTFQWLETKSHDPELKGYFQHLTREGDVIQRPDDVASTAELGYKDQNSSIHLLEAFTSLYAVWPDSLLRERLSEMFFLIKDQIVNDRNHMDLFFTADWTPVSYRNTDRETIMQHAWIDHISFGHDIEIAFLLLEAAELLDIHDEETVAKCRAITDHALKGWDDTNGGLFDQGYYFSDDQPMEIIRTTKEWWAQAEALNTLLIFHSYFPDAGYDDYFLKQWNYIQTHLSDKANGGWYTYGADTDPKANTYPKASIWKSTYHNYRALAHCLEILEKNKLQDD